MSARTIPARSHARAARTLLLGLALCLAAATAAAPAVPAPAKADPRSLPTGSAGAAAPTPARAAPRADSSPAAMRALAGQAREARGLEENGAYGLAAAELRGVRARVTPDADLELALALDEARSGEADSAWTRLSGPLLTAALADTGDVTRRHLYPFNRDESWLNGRFDGWAWYVARARAEVALSLGRWDEARDAARQAVAMRPLAGKEWLLLALCEARAGEAARARESAAQAVYLDGTLPEACYLDGLFAWREGRRAEAASRFAQAVALDSLYERAVRARQRLRFFPGAAPDSLPAEFLTGERRVGLLTSSERPKLEELVQMDQPALIVRRTMLPVPDSLQHLELSPLEIVLPLFVDARGRPVLHELPWLPPGRLPAPFAALIVRSLPAWEFKAARRAGEPRASWTGVTITTGAATPAR